MDMYERALGLLPPEIRDAGARYTGKNVEEIRLRLDSKPAILTQQCEIEICDAPLKKESLELVLERACSASIHAHIDEMSRGYLNHRGLRIGFGASAVMKDGHIASFKDFTSLNIRIPSVFCGEIDEIYRILKTDSTGNIIIVSPPGGGKTTLLRELIRRFSNEGVRVAVADERNEIGASCQGRNYFDLGSHTDVLVGLDKKTSAMLLLRGMNPQMIALDEISHSKDMETVFDIVGCGVRILASAHGKNVQELKKRELYRILLNERIFTDAVIIDNSSNGRKYTHKRLI